MAPKGTLALLLALSAGCAGSTVVQTVGPQSVRNELPGGMARGGGPSNSFVPAGTQMTIAMETPVDTRQSNAGETFVARLRSPVLSTSGVVILPAGTVLTGRVAAVGEGRVPLIRLAFDDVRTPQGMARLQVRVRRADRVVYRGPQREVMPPAGPAWDMAVHTPTMGQPMQYSIGERGGTALSTSYVGRPLEARLERGSELQLELTRPLAP